MWAHDFYVIKSTKKTENYEKQVFFFQFENVYFR